MAANYWLSTQCNAWLLDPDRVAGTREEDRRYASSEEVAAIGIWCSTVISALSKRMDLRQRVIATANVYCKRFYCKNAYAATDVMLVMAACVYLAAKVEEMPVRIRTFCAEASRLYVEMGLCETTLQVETLAEMEFYLLEELEFDLVVFHPYRTLQKLAAMRGGAPSVADTACADGATAADPPGYATAFARSIEDKVYHLAWFIINDAYWTELPLLYPPYLIAIASLYLSLVLHPSTAQHVDEAVRKRKATGPPEANGKDATQPDTSEKDSELPAPTQSDTPEILLAFLARLNVSLPLVAEIAQALLANYALWRRVRAGRPGSEGSNLVGIVRDHAGMLARLRRMRTTRRERMLRTSSNS